MGTQFSDFDTPYTSPREQEGEQMSRLEKVTQEQISSQRKASKPLESFQRTRTKVSATKNLEKKFEINRADGDNFERLTTIMERLKNEMEAETQSILEMEVEAKKYVRRSLWRDSRPYRLVVGLLCQAIHNYIAKTTEVLRERSLRKGELVAVIMIGDDGWWCISSHNTRGGDSWVPMRCLEIYDPKNDRCVFRDNSYPSGNLPLYLFNPSRGFNINFKELSAFVEPFCSHGRLGCGQGLVEVKLKPDRCDYDIAAFPSVFKGHPVKYYTEDGPDNHWADLGNIESNKKPKEVAVVLLNPTLKTSSTVFARLRDIWQEIFLSGKSLGICVCRSINCRDE